MITIPGGVDANGKRWLPFDLNNVHMLSLKVSRSVSPLFTKHTEKMH